MTTSLFSPNGNSTTDVTTHEATAMMVTGTKEGNLVLKETTASAFSRISRLQWLGVSCCLVHRSGPKYTQVQTLTRKRRVVA
jgi:hypothetical protein